MNARTNRVYTAYESGMYYYVHRLALSWSE